MTQLLYREDPFLQQFNATVTDCIPQGEDIFLITLDRTAFYPEGGGQPCDTGTINDIAVTDVHEQNGEVLHTTARALAVGTAVTGQIDFERRRDHMEQHTGEHILSGTLHRLFGAENVGFHIGQPWVRMDMDIPLSAEQLARAEEQANRIVRQNVPVQVLYPTPAELEKLEYRSKKELDGQVRIVDIPGADTCACCGTHLFFSGQVGLIKIISAQNYKGGTRLAVACGGRAFTAVQSMQQQIDRLSVLLSAKPELVAPAAERLYEENQQNKFARTARENRIIELLAQNITPGQVPIVWEEGLPPAALARLASSLTRRTDGVCAVFSPGENGVYYALAQAEGDVRELCKKMNQTFGGRGGGKANLCQGSLPAVSPKQIQEFFQ